MLPFVPANVDDTRLVALIVFTLLRVLLDTLMKASWVVTDVRLTVLRLQRDLLSQSITAFGDVRIVCDTVVALRIFTFDRVLLDTLIILVGSVVVMVRVVRVVAVAVVALRDPVWTLLAVSVLAIMVGAWMLPVATMLPRTSIA